MQNVRKSNKWVLLGAIGRYNFGDLLFAHVTEQLIKMEYPECELVFCDVLGRDMTSFGGHQVESILDVDITGDTNVVTIGGQVSGCNSHNAIKMFDCATSIERDRWANQLNQLAYIANRLKNSKGFFAANAIGGYPLSAKSEEAVDTSITELLKKYNYVGFRDMKSYKLAINSGIQDAYYTPDSAVMVKKLLDHKVVDRDRTPVIDRLKDITDSNYIAIQLNTHTLIKGEQLILAGVEKLLKNTNKSIILFCAGTAPGHDDMVLYEQVFSGLADDYPNRVNYLHEHNTWNVVNIIKGASCVIGTSLHVRIISAIYERPRTRLYLHKSTMKPRSGKHNQFIYDHDCSKERSTLMTFSDDVIRIMNEHDTGLDAVNRQWLEQSYMKFNFLNADKRFSL